MACRSALRPAARCHIGGTLRSTAYTLCIVELDWKVSHRVMSNHQC